MKCPRMITKIAEEVYFEPPNKEEARKIRERVLLDHGKGPDVKYNPELQNELNKGSVPFAWGGLGLSAAGTGLGISKYLTTPLGELSPKSYITPVALAAGGLASSIVSSILAKKKVDKFYGDRGIKMKGVNTVKSLTADAAKKYMSNKYPGGGVDA